MSVPQGTIARQRTDLDRLRCDLAAARREAEANGATVKAQQAEIGKARAHLAHARRGGWVMRLPKLYPYLITYRRGARRIGFGIRFYPTDAAASEDASRLIPTLVPRALEIRTRAVHLCLHADPPCPWAKDREIMGAAHAIVDRITGTILDEEPDTIVHWIAEELSKRRSPREGK